MAKVSEDLEDLLAALPQDVLAGRRAPLEPAHLGAGGDVVVRQDQGVVEPI